MIYVLTSIGYDEQFNIIQLIKIGYAKNFKRRFEQYKLHNPLIKVLFEIEKGTELLEHKLHKYFDKHKYEGYGNEWFYYNDEIIEFFRNNKTIISIESKLSDINIDIGNYKNSHNSKRHLNNILGLFIGYNWSYDLCNYYKSEEILYKELMHLKLNIDSILSFKNYVLKNNPNIKFRELSNLYVSNKEIQSELNGFFKKYNPIKNNIQEVLRLFCETNLSDTARDRIYELLSSKIKSYLSLGKEKLRSIKYIPEKIERLLNNETINIDDIIYSRYKPGDKLVKSDLKKELQNIYDKSGLSKKAKATDIEEWFNTKRCKINGKRRNFIRR